MWEDGCEDCESDDEIYDGNIMLPCSLKWREFGRDARFDNIWLPLRLGFVLLEIAGVPPSVWAGEIVDCEGVECGWELLEVE